MERTEATKTCHMCFEEIDARARKCPHCATGQGWLFTTIGQMTLGLLPVGAALIIVLLTAYPLVRYLTDKGEDFEQYRDKVQVTDTSMFFTEDDEGQRMVRVVGLLRNDTDVTWRLGDVEVLFLNAEGKLIDAGRVWSVWAIYPRSERAFEAMERIEEPEDQYVSCRVRILGARDADAPLAFLREP